MAKILIVDDQPDNLYVLDRLLRREGHEVLQADRGQLALDVAQREQPDLVLLDVMMPGMDGFEVVQRLRADPGTQSLPVVLLTANAPDQRTKIQALNLGADEYLTQPVNNSELLARIRALLRTKQAQNELVAANSQLRAVLDVIQAGASTLDLAQVSARLIEAAGRAVRVEAGGIWLRQDNAWRRIAEMGFEQQRVRSRERLTGRIAPVIEQVLRDRLPHYGSMEQLFGSGARFGAGLCCGVVLPLIHRDNIVGILLLATRTERNFASEDMQFLSALANAAAVAVQNAHLFEETDRQRTTLQKLDNEKDEFISIIVHELKNPLASIKGYAGLLTRRARKEPSLLPSLKGLDIIEQQVNRMTALLDQLRDVSHIGINRFSVEPQPVDLVELLRQVVSTVQTTTSDHIISLAAPDEPLLAPVDEFRIEQVFSNLVGNAIKYSPDGGPVEVTIKQSDELPASGMRPAIAAGWVLITVKDYGIGIPEEGRDRLFERFFRAPNAKGRVSGMGLGLFISREIVQRHNGLMWVESEEGKGSLFGVALPLLGVSSHRAKHDEHEPYSEGEA